MQNCYHNTKTLENYILRNRVMFPAKCFEEMTYSTRKHRDSVRGLIQVDPVLHREYHSNGPRGLSIS